MPGVNPPSGTRDYLAADLRKRRYVISTIQEVYESFGFEPLETPAIENLSTLLGKYGEEGDQLLFRVLKRGDKLQQAMAATDKISQNTLSDLALKYDLTVPLARVMARFGSQLPKYYKRYQIQPVWRADRPAKGRFREFIQCDLDVCGSESPLVEVEILSAACTVFKRLDFTDFTIMINHREILRGLIDSAEIPENLETTALVAIDKLDKIGREGVVGELVKRGIASISAQKLLDTLSEVNGINKNASRLKFLRSELTRPTALTALDDIERILALSQVTPAGSHLSINTSLARGLSYYTGAIFEVVVPGGVGSLGGGGRYDELLGMFAGRKIPACGFSLGLERILLLLDERDTSKKNEGSVDILFTYFDDTLTDILELANRIRKAGITCDIFPESKNLKQQFNYAAARQARYVAFFGAQEKQAGQIRLKRQSDGKEIIVTTTNLETELNIVRQ